MNQRSILVSVTVPFAALAALGCEAQVPRTPWGDPDLQGLWSNATLTPLQRPDALGDKAFFTPEEAEVYVAERIEATNADRTIGQTGSVGSYNDAWFDRGNSIVPTLRTSLIVDPADGKVPPFTPEAQEQHEANLVYSQEHPADTPADRPLAERCIVFGGGVAPLFPEPYNHNYYIVQTPDYVTILAEFNHEVRIIPIDGRPHFPEHVTQWTGDSRGYWDGDTLVVETRNQKTDPSFYGVQMFNSVMSDQFSVVERFTRTAPDQIRYEATIEDPAVFTVPWSIELFMHPQEGLLVEYACHEGNYGLTGILSAARAEERRAAEAESAEQ